MSVARAMHPTLTILENSCEQVYVRERENVLCDGVVGGSDVCDKVACDKVVCDKVVCNAVVRATRFPPVMRARVLCDPGLVSGF